METDEPPRAGGPATASWPKLRLLLNWKSLVAAAVVVASLIALGSIHANTRPATEAAQPITIAVARVLRGDLSQDQEFEAELRPYQEIDLHAKVAGFVRTINVDIGDRVEAGQLLATLEIPELPEDLERAGAAERRADAEVNRSSAAYEDAHLSFTRLTAINQDKPHLIAQQDLDSAQAKDATASAALAAARQEVQVAQAEVKKLQAMLDYCKITAPFSGVITRRFADEGTLVQGGVTSSSGGAMPLVRLSQTDRLRLVFPVSVSFVLQITNGDAAEVRIQGREKPIEGAVCRFTRRVDTATRTMEAEVDLPNSDLALIPGVYATVSLKLVHRENVLTVPTEAISRQKAPTVVVLNGRNETEERTVTLGLETPEKCEVVAGLKENDLVMIGNRTGIKPGQKVEPKLILTGVSQ